MKLEISLRPADKTAPSNNHQSKIDLINHSFRCKESDTTAVTPVIKYPSGVTTQIFMQALSQAEVKLLQKGVSRPPNAPEVSRTLLEMGYQLSPDGVRERVRRYNCEAAAGTHLIKLSRRRVLRSTPVPEKVLKQAFRTALKRLQKERIIRRPVADEVCVELRKMGYNTKRQAVRKRFQKIARREGSRYALCSWRNIVSPEMYKKVYRSTCRRLGRWPTQSEMIEKLSEATKLPVTKKVERDVRSRLNREAKGKSQLFILNAYYGGVFDSDIVAAHKAFVSSRHKLPTASELLSYLKERHKKISLSKPQLYRRVTWLQGKGLSINLRGNTVASKEMVISSFAALKAELGSAPNYDQIRDRVKAVYGIELKSNTAISSALREHRQSLPEAERQQWQSGSAVTELRQEEFEEAFLEASRICNHPFGCADIDVMKTLLGCSETPIYRVKSLVNIRRAQEGRFPLMLSGELAARRYSLVSAYAVGLRSTDPDTQPMAVAGAVLGKKTSDVRQQLVHLQNLASNCGLPDLPLPKSTAMLAEINRDFLLEVVRKYQLWAITAAVLKPEQHSSAATAGRNDEARLFGRLNEYNSWNGTDLHSITGAIPVLRAALEEGRIHPLTYRSFSEQWQLDTSDFNHLRFLFSYQIRSLLVECGVDTELRY